MKSLVIAEKPSVARDIARVLKCGKNINGAIEGDRYVVTWGLGHLVTLADPEDYDKKYKEWKMEDLPMMPEVFKLEVIKQTSKQYQAVKTQIYRGDVGDIIIATDAGREGELVARLILKKTGCNKPIRRLWISSVTDKAIREGFANLKDGREYNNLYDAAMCRAEADWLVGINATRALTCKYNAQLSCGRVQTPTLAMIAKREADIKSFVPKPYYGLQARKDGLVFTCAEGTVLVDGVDVRDYTFDALYDRIGYVTQKAILFSGDVRGNVLFGASRGKDSDADVQKALELAQASEFVDRMPGGIHAPIAEGGTNVSGGQKQRLSIARALARRPEILVFDDSFSALDYRTDTRLRAGLDRELKDTTRLIVAQRIGTIRNADKIIVLDERKMVGMGTHRELMARNGFYASLYRSQFEAA